MMSEMAATEQAMGDSADSPKSKKENSPAVSPNPAVSPSLETKMKEVSLGDTKSTSRETTPTRKAQRVYAEKTEQPDQKDAKSSDLPDQPAGQQDQKQVPPCLYFSIFSIGLTCLTHRVY